MTCREKLKIEHPECVDDNCIGGCRGCPSASTYGYLDDPDYCADPNEQTCRACWDREIHEAWDEEKQEIVNLPYIKDSGNRREFETGAVRDIQEGKGRCDLLPLDVVAEWMEDAILGYIANFQQEGDVEELYNALNAYTEFVPGDTPCTHMILEVSKHFEEGAKKYGEYNWQKGIPTHCYIDSAVRHYLKFLRGDKDEPHDRAFVWNILCCIWTCKHKPELNDYAPRENRKENDV